jgi:hypothetical protein
MARSRFPLEVCRASARPPACPPAGPPLTRFCSPAAGARPADEVEAVVRLLRELRGTHALARTVFVVAIEGDHSPMVANGFYAALRRMSGVVFMRENRRSPESPCVIKGQLGGMYQRVAEAFFRLDRVSWARDARTGDSGSAADVHRKLVTQLGQYRLVRRTVRDRRFAHADGGTWTGKTARGGNDDLMTALVMTLYWAAVFYAEPRYGRVRGTPCEVIPFLRGVYNADGGVARAAGLRDDVAAAQRLRRAATAAPPARDGAQRWQ